VTFSLPMDHLVIDDLVIPADRFSMGGVDHDVDAGTVTVTFCNVRRVETVYRHMLIGTKEASCLPGSRS
jgi:hypothetical protein